jgi:hypothetical protein
MAAQRKAKCLTCPRPAEVRNLCRACHQAIYRAGRLSDPTAVTDGLIGPAKVKASAWAKAAAKVSRKKSALTK